MKGLFNSRATIDLNQKLCSDSWRLFTDQFHDRLTASTIELTCSMVASESSLKNRRAEFAATVEIVAEDEESYFSAVQRWLTMGRIAILWRLRSWILQGRAHEESDRSYLRSSFNGEPLFKMNLRTDIYPGEDFRPGWSSWQNCRLLMDLEKIPVPRQSGFTDWFLHPHNKAAIEVACGVVAERRESKLSPALVSLAVNISADDEMSFWGAEKLWHQCGRDTALSALRSELRAGKGNRHFTVIEKPCRPGTVSPYRLSLDATILKPEPVLSEWELLFAKGAKPFIDKPILPLPKPAESVESSEIIHA